MLCRIPNEYKFTSVPSKKRQYGSNYIYTKFVMEFGIMNLGLGSYEDLILFL